MSKDKAPNIDSAVKGLSPGFTTNVYSKLDRLLFDKNTEYYADIQDQYIRLAFTTFLEDNHFSKKDSQGRYIFLSVEERIYKFTEERPDVKVYDLPDDWEILRLKISTYIKDNPIDEDNEIKVETFNATAIKEALGIKEEEEARIYLIDSDNNRYYKGYSMIDNIEVILRSYDNEIVFETEHKFDDEDEEFQFTEKLKMDNITEIYDRTEWDDDRVEIKVYDSSKDGLLKSKIEIEVEGLTDELKEKGFATLSDGRVIVSKSYKDNKKKEIEVDTEREEYIKEAQEEYKESMGYEVGDDFLFSVGDGTNLGTGQDYFFAIQPKSYWDNNGYQYDQHVEYLTNIPSEFGEVCESTFEYQGTVEDRIKDLVEKGFKFQDDFQDFIDDANVVTVNNGMTVRQYVDTL